MGEVNTKAVHAVRDARQSKTSLHHRTHHLTRLSKHMPSKQAHIGQNKTQRERTNRVAQVHATKPFARLREIAVCTVLPDKRPQVLAKTPIIAHSQCRAVSNHEPSSLATPAVPYHHGGHHTIFFFLRMEYAPSANKGKVASVTKKLSCNM